MQQDATSGKWNCFFEEFEAELKSRRNDNQNWQLQNLAKRQAWFDPIPFAYEAEKLAEKGRLRGRKRQWYGRIGSSPDIPKLESLILEFRNN